MDKTACDINLESKSSIAIASSDLQNALPCISDQRSIQSVTETFQRPPKYKKLYKNACANSSKSSGDKSFVLEVQFEKLKLEIAKKPSKTNPFQTKKNLLFFESLGLQEEKRKRKIISSYATSYKVSYHINSSCLYCIALVLKINIKGFIFVSHLAYGFRLIL